MRSSGSSMLLLVDWDSWRSCSEKDRSQETHLYGVVVQIVKLSLPWMPLCPRVLWISAKPQTNCCHCLCPYRYLYLCPHSHHRCPHLHPRLRHLHSSQYPPPKGFARCTLLISLRDDLLHNLLLQFTCILNLQHDILNKVGPQI
jgi:hypothetical protein